MIFRYVKKLPVILPDVIQYFKERLIFDEDDYGHRYRKQIELFDFIYNKIDDNADYLLFVGTLLEISPIFLKTNFQQSKSGRVKSSIVMYEVRIEKTDRIEIFRKKIFEKIFSLDTSNKDKKTLFLENYNSFILGNKNQKDIYSYDTQFVIPFIEKQLSPKIFRHCRVTHSYCEKLKRMEINHPEIQELIDRFRSEKFNIHEVLTFNYLNWYKKGETGGTEEFTSYNKERLEDYFSEYKLEDFFQLLEIMDELIKNDNKDAHWIATSLELIILNILKRSPNDCFALVQRLFEINNPFGFYSYKITYELLQSFPIKTVYSTITQYEFKARDNWLLHFFMNLKSEQVNLFYKDELLQLYSSIQGSVGLFFDFLKNFKNIEPSIFSIVFNLLLDRVETEGFHINFFPSSCFKENFSELRKELNTLKRLYLYSYLKQDSPFDSNGEHFIKIYRFDNEFLFEFVDKVLQDNRVYSYRKLELNLSFIWDYDNAEKIIEKLIETTLKQNAYSGIEHLASNFFTSSEKSQRIDNFFNDYIQQNSTNKNRMRTIFNIIRQSYPRERVKYLKILLSHNTDFEMWCSLPIASGGSSGAVSSLIPYYEEQVELWETVLPILSGSVELLKHRQYVKQKIKSLRNQIEEEIEGDFIDDY